MLMNIFKKYSKPKTTLKQNQRGIAAIEFALVVPIIVILLLGSIDAVFALTAKRKVSLATHSMADISARESDVRGLLPTISDLGKLIMTPNDISQAQIVISGATVDSSGMKAVVAWSGAFGPNATQLAKDSKIDLPGQLNSGIFLVVTSTQLPYQTLTRNSITLSETAYFQSRSGQPIIGP